eukprot:2738706-Pyramimonas_sp.AAC.2
MVWMLGAIAWMLGAMSWMLGAMMWVLRATTWMLGAMMGMLRAMVWMSSTSSACCGVHTRLRGGPWVSYASPLVEGARAPGLGTGALSR